ncbi:MAG: DUF1007 family protein [Pelagimonas sp.]|jgi:ABC-type uncharacterized transport system substrate-binding protein|nr:DUF1007 family protein [Pelagimonas sp.]
MTPSLRFVEFDWSAALLGLCAGGALAALGASPALAHPHVFVDGGVDFQFNADRQLQSLQVTWLYDAFETLYMLSAEGMNLTPQGTLDEADRLELVRRLSNWPEDFDGSAHLKIDGAEIALDWPSGLDAQMIDGRLQLTFTRALSDPLDLRGITAEVAFFESTYFFDFTLTKAPELRGNAMGCGPQVIPFDPDSNDQELLDVLAKLSREETSGIDNVGAFFADQIILRCD